MNSFIQDLQYGLRSLARNPGFAAVAVLTLALGVGANTAIFSVLRAVVLRDLPYHDPDGIAVMWTRNIRQNLPDGSSYLNFRDWKEQSKQFEAMAAYIRPEFTRGTLIDGSGAERINLALVGPGFFELLGAAPVLGRTFESGDFSATTRAVVIGHRLWQQRFAADHGVLGRTVQLDDAQVEIVGVMPPEFALPTSEVQLWKPLWFGPGWEKEGRDGDGLVVLGRMAPSATIFSARAEMDAIAARLAERYPQIRSLIASSDGRRNGRCGCCSRPWVSCS
jgi:putative ABC transport system permease protein